MSYPHDFWMQRCLDLAQQGAGFVSPNPLVGSVIISSSGQVLGEGFHAAFGKAHAEVNAIQNAVQVHHLQALKDATLYVNLEPCSHFGKTPPCADLILETGIPRVVLGMTDPNPKVAGKGIKRLRENGVEVVENVLNNACKRLNEAFVHHLSTGYPLVHLKIAQTLDGQIATASGDSKWVSDEVSRTQVHRWRASLDAVLIGFNTALQDDPALTVRHVTGRQPYRIILDRAGKLPPSLKLFNDEYLSQTLVFNSPEQSPSYATHLRKGDGKAIPVSTVNGHLDLREILKLLGAGLAGKPIQSVLVEAGPSLATAFLKENLVDRMSVFIAPKLIGRGTPALYDIGVQHMAEARTFIEHQWQVLGNDVLFTGYFNAV